MLGSNTEDVVGFLINCFSSFTVKGSSVENNKLDILWSLNGLLVGQGMNLRIDEFFRNYMVVFWSNLSRLNNLLIILNITMFFLSGLIAQGYFYTFYSIGCFAFVAILTILPVPFIGRLWFYLLNLLIEFAGIYFLVASIIYWVQAGGQVPT